MKGCGEKVNWSAIASEAFAAEVARINTRKEKAKMDDVIARLRASQREGVSLLFERGREAGEEWAKQEAEAIELRRLEQARYETKSEVKSGFDNWLVGIHPDSRLSARSRFVQIIRPTEHALDCESTVEDFWDEALDDLACDSGDSEFVHGFADGALDIWEEVANKL
jgi:hypothetical protein